jgi:hypothetical protein
MLHLSGDSFPGINVIKLFSLSITLLTDRLEGFKLASLRTEYNMVPVYRTGQGKARLKGLTKDKRPSLFVESVSDN